MPDGAGGGAGRPRGGAAHRVDAGARCRTLVEAGAVLVDGARGGQEPPARGRRGDRAARRARGRPACPEPDPSVRGRRAPRGRRRDRGGQARRARRAPGRRAPRRHARQRAARALPGDRATSATRPRPGIVHRLDRDTSGLLVVARSPAAYEALGRDARRARRRARLPRAGVGRARLATRGDRRADRAVGPAPDAHGGARGRPQRAHRLRGACARSASPTSRSSSAGSRPAAPTRSACTSRPSATRWWATPRTAARRAALALDRPFLHAGRLAFAPPGHRRPGAGGGAAGPRAGRGARRLDLIPVLSLSLGQS